MERLTLQNKNQKGQALIELIVAIAVTSTVLPAVLTGMVASREGKLQEGNRIQATVVMREMTEAVRNMRDNNWSQLATNGTYYPTVSGSMWTLASGSQTIGQLTRQLTISDVQRDSTGAITATGGNADAATKKITYTVAWTIPTPGSITETEYLTRFKNNSTLTETGTADFVAGNHTNTTAVSTGGGAVELQPPTASSGTFSDTYNTASDYNFDSNAVEVTGGYAQLKNTGGPVASTITNGTFNTNATGWTFARWGDAVSSTGAYVSTGGNPGGYVNISMPSTKSKVAGAYWYQAINNTVTNPTSSLSFQYRVTSYSASPDDFRILVYLDNNSGTPVNQVWTSPNLTATSSWSGTVTVNTSTFMTAPGTYYLKIATYVDYPTSNKGPYTVGYDNVSFSWNGNTTSYSTASPTIYRNQSFTNASLTGWTSFTETAILNGGSIMYQLSDDGGITWKYYAGGANTNWVPVTASTQYNSASTIDQRISGFPSTSKSIKVKAFLISNGTQQVRLDQVDIGYSGGSSTNTGTFVSQSIDLTNSVGFNRLIWTESNTTNTTTQLQIATNNDNSTWNYVGPDGTASTYFTGGSGTIPVINNTNRYLKYKIFFTSTNADIPSVSEVVVNYSP
jgi:type II secretory pathway pseudopilin PulG